jgi:DedD protein
MSSTFADSEFDETIDSQLTLGTASLLGIFFGLVMVCGIFFGFGYSFGRRSFSQSAAVHAPAHLITSQKPVVTAPTPEMTAKAIAPAPSQLAPAPVALPALQQPTASVARVQAPAAMQLPPVPVPALGHARLAAKASVHAAPLSTATLASANSLASANVAPSAVLRQVLSKPSAIHPVMEEPTASIPYARRAGISPNALSTAATPYIYTPPFYVHGHGAVTHRAVFTTAHDSLTTPHESLVVQIAAMSRQDDAEVLASSLRRHGFATSIHNDAQDSLYHVQVGPYQRNVALAARQKLIANGYNAVLK